MPVDPNIALSVNAPQFGPPVTQTLGSLMNLADVASQVRQRQAQTQQSIQQGQDIAAQAQQRQQPLRDQQTIQQYMRDPGNQAKVARGDLSGLQGQVQPMSLAAYGNSLAEYKKNLAGATTAENSVKSEAAGQMAKTIGGLLNFKKDDGTPDLDRINAALPSAISQLQTEGYPQQLGIDITKFPKTITDVNQLHDAAAQFGFEKALHDNQIAEQEAAQKIATGKAAEVASTAEAALHGAQAPGAQAESEIKAAQAAAVKNLNPTTINTQVDAELNPARYSDPKIREEVQRENAIAKTAALAALPNGFPAVQAAIKDSADRIGRLTAGVAQAAATLPTKIQLVNAGIAGHEGVQEREAGRAAYTKSKEDLNNAKATTQEMGDIINLARGKNKVAYAYAPTTGVLTINSANGTKRVNMAEIQQYSGAGNIVDRIKGYLGKQATGASIPDNILNDMDQLHKTLLNSAVTKHNANVGTINGTYGTNFDKETAPAAPSATAPQFKAGDTVMYQGKPHKVRAVDPTTGKLSLEP